MKMTLRGLLLATLAAVGFIGCGFSDSYYEVGDRTQRQELSQVLRGINDGRESDESRFILIQQVIKSLQGAPQRLNLFLTDYVARHPKDPYNAYYLYVVAQDYADSDAPPLAIHYFDRIVKNYPDLLVHGTSVHYLSLTNLIKLADDPERRVEYYKDLIARFGDKIQTGPAYYFLGRSYAALGEWDLEMEAFKEFLAAPDVPVSGYPDARNAVSDIIAFYEYQNKDWTMPSLSDLVSAIRSAIESQNTSLLAHYRAKVGFFARSWESESFPVSEDFLTDFGVFLNPSVWMSDTLDIDSNSREAYLRTGGWTYRIETWYLYFRKINFPADPSVQGQWEWAGIYFGDKPFADESRAQG